MSSTSRRPSRGAQRPSRTSAAGAKLAVAVACTSASTSAFAADVDVSSGDGNYASAWLRLDADRVGLQLWLGGTQSVGAVDLALNVVASQSYPGVVDPTQSPAYNAALGESYRAPSVRLELGPALSWGGLFVLPKLGIGYDFERGRVAPLVPQLIFILQGGPGYLESWHQVFLYDLFEAGAQDSYYTRNQLLIALVPEVSIGVETDITVAVKNSAGDAVRSWPVGVVTNMELAPTFTLGAFIGYETQPEARNSRNDSLAGRLTATALWR
jgi:hypothetical protein